MVWGAGEGVMTSMLERYLRGMNRHGRGRSDPGEASEPLRFIVHMRATHMPHYDLGLEVGGVFRSWLLVQCLSLDPTVERMALQLSNRSLEEAEREDEPVAGECGTGEVVVWDTGVYSPDDDCTFFFGDRYEAEERMERGIGAGRFSVFFWGYKLAGSWAFRQTGGGQWVIRKRDDLFVDPSRDLSLENRSVVSGRVIGSAKE